MSQDEPAPEDVEFGDEDPADAVNADDEEETEP